MAHSSNHFYSYVTGAPHHLFSEEILRHFNQIIKCLILPQNFVTAISQTTKLLLDRIVIHSVPLLG
eukprot:COSAG05_NODE_2728_length_2712_cov_2.977507_2_plen_66_part_00